MADSSPATRRAAKRLVVLTALALGTYLVVTDPFVLPSNLPEGMPLAAPQRSVAIFILCMALWFTNIIPLAATGVLAIALLPLLNVLPRDQAFGLFGNSAVFFMLGVFLLAAATISTGLSKRVTLLALKHFDGSPTRLVVGVGVFASFLSLWMPEHAVAAMMYPIVVEIISALNLRQGANYAKKLFLALAWGCVIGGVGTFLGGARAPLALSILHEAHPETTIGFISWAIAAVPVVLLLTPLALWRLCAVVPNDVEDIKAATRFIDERVRILGPMSYRERRLALLNLVTIAAWIVLGHRVDLAVVAMLSATGLFVLRIADWSSLQGFVNWGVLIMYGGAVALGRAVTETRAMDFLVAQIVSPDMPALAVVMLMATAAILLTEGISNSAAVAILLPVGFSVGDMTGVGPAMITLSVTVPAGLAFLLPVGSPPNAISFSAGHYSIRESIQIGWPLSVGGLLVLFLVILFWWGPVLGVNAW